MRWCSKLQQATIGVYLYRRVRQHLFACATGIIYQDTTPDSDRPLIERRNEPTRGNRERPRKSCGGQLMDTETSLITNAKTLERASTNATDNIRRKTVPAQLGYSTLAFALDGSRSLHALSRVLFN